MGYASTSEDIERRVEDAIFMSGLHLQQRDLAQLRAAVRQWLEPILVEAARAKGDLDAARREIDELTAENKRLQIKFDALRREHDTMMCDGSREIAALREQLASERLHVDQLKSRDGAHIERIRVIDSLRGEMASQRAALEDAQREIMRLRDENIQLGRLVMERQVDRRVR